MTTATEQSVQFEAWKGFEPGPWTENIDVRDFIQRNYTPYDGDSSFLAGPTEKTKNVWNHLEENYLSIERQKRIFDVDTHTPSDIDAFPAGYICEDDNVIVGLQTDSPLKRAMMPNGGWRMVKQAIFEAGKEVDPDVEKSLRYLHPAHPRSAFLSHHHRPAGCLWPRPHHW